MVSDYWCSFVQRTTQRVDTHQPVRSTDHTTLRENVQCWHSWSQASQNNIIWRWFCLFIIVITIITVLPFITMSEWEGERGRNFNHTCLHIHNVVYPWLWVCEVYSVYAFLFVCFLFFFFMWVVSFIRDFLALGLSYKYVWQDLSFFSFFFFCCLLVA